MSGTVSKHVTILGELSRIVASYRLLELSECQQELVCGSDHGLILQRIHSLVTNTKVREKDAVKLVMLYALRHQNHPNNDIRGLILALKKRSVSESHLKSISSILEYGGAQSRQSDLFESELPQDVSSIKRRLFKGVKGVDNVYTQHKPLVVQTISAALKGRLKESQFPYCGVPASPDSLKPQVVIVFIVGGVTLEESSTIHLMNISTPNIKIFLGGSYVHNSESFIEAVNEAMEGLPRKTLRL